MHIDDVIFVVFLCMRRTSLLFSSQRHALKFCSWCSAIYYYLFVGFNILFAKTYAFIHISLYVWTLSKKKFFCGCGFILKFSKYSHVWSYFEDFDARNIMLQSKFNLDIHSGIYGFLFQKCFHVGNVIFFVFSPCMLMSFPSPCANSQIYWTRKWPTKYIQHPFALSDIQPRPSTRP